jgi:hypothetical protein
MAFSAIGFCTRGGISRGTNSPSLTTQRAPSIRPPGNNRPQSLNDRLQPVCRIVGLEVVAPACE